MQIRGTIVRFVVGLLFATLTFSSPAEARRGVSYEFLIHAGETNLVDPEGRALSACHHIRMHTYLWLGVWTRNQGLVLAPFGCDTEIYYDLPPQGLAGFEPAGLTPELALHYARGFAWPAIVLLLLAISPFLRKRQAQDRATRQAILGISDPLEFGAVDALLHLMRLRGRLNVRELAVATRAIEELTDMEIAGKKIAAAAKKAQNLSFGISYSGPVIRKMVRGIPDHVRFPYLLLTSHVAAASGRPNRAQRKFLDHVRKGLGISRGDLKRLERSDAQRA